MAYLKSDQTISGNFDAVIQSTTPVYIASKDWKKYCDFQAEYVSRIDVLRTEKREVPIQEGADRNMPPIPTGWTGNFKTTQDPKKNVKLDCSCAFDDNRIKEYEKRNAEFQKDIQGGCRLAAAKMLALMTLDIAFLKSFEVEWAAPISALECGEADADADDDDNETVDMDTSSWDVTNPD